MRETREEYFKNTLPNFTTEGMCDLSEVFRHMAKTAKLLGSAIYKIQEVWKGPDKLQQANYVLRALPKGLKFLRAVPPLQSPKVRGLVDIHDPDALYAASVACPTAHGVGRRARMRGQSSTTFGWCITGSAWCVTNVTTTHQPHQTPSTTMASRTANPLERETPMSQPHLGNCQQEMYKLNLSQLGI